MIEARWRRGLSDPSNSGGALGNAAILNLLLTANNTWIIGLPVMEATFGSAGRLVALLTGT
jgi:hypothetical protein